MIKNRIIKKNKAVAEILGTVMLLAMAVLIVSSITLVVLSNSPESKPPFIVLVATLEGNNIILEHRGGESLNLDTEICIKIKDFEESMTAIDYLDDDSKQDGLWDIGEKLVYPFNYDIDISEAEITAVDGKTKSLILAGVLDINPESDIGLEFKVNNRFPTIGTNIEITITVTHYHGDITASDIQIKTFLPFDDLIYISNVTSQGEYNYNTGLWNIDDLIVGESATLIIIANVAASNGEIMPTQLGIILDGSLSISYNNWTTMTRGIADAINSDSFPHDGSVELTIVQFGGINNYYPNARVELGPITVDQTNYEDLAESIWDGTPQIDQMGGYTPMACGLALAIDTLESSENFATHKHVINLITDGLPNAVYNLEDGDYRMESGSWGTNPEDYENGKASAFNARNYVISKFYSEDDELDSEAVMGNMDYGYPDHVWLQNEIVWPQPGYINWPPAGPGWVRKVDTWEQLPDTLEEKFSLIFNSLSISAEIISSIPLDPNIDNNIAEISITPQN